MATNLGRTQADAAWRMQRARATAHYKPTDMEQRAARGAHLTLGRKVEPLPVSKRVSSGVAPTKHTTHRIERAYIDASDVSNILTEPTSQTLYEILVYSEQRGAGFRALVWANGVVDLTSRVAQELPEDYTLDVYFPHSERAAFLPPTRKDTTV